MANILLSYVVIDEAINFRAIPNVDWNNFISVAFSNQGTANVIINKQFILLPRGVPFTTPHFNMFPDPSILKANEIDTSDYMIEFDLAGNPPFLCLATIKSCAQ